MKFAFFLVVLGVFSISKPFRELLQMLESDLVADGVIIDQEDLEDISEEMDEDMTTEVIF